MRILWTDEALGDLEEILAYYYLEASPRVAEAVAKRIVGEIESLPPYPERIRESDRIPGARELVVNKVPYLVFVQLREDAIVVLNVVHTKRKFPNYQNRHGIRTRPYENRRGASESRTRTCEVPPDHRIRRERSALLRRSGIPPGIQRLLARPAFRPNLAAGVLRPDGAGGSQ